MKYKEIAKLTKNEREKKLKELKTELVKENASKQGGNKSKKIKKIIARIYTLNTSENKNSNKVEK